MDLIAKLGCFSAVSTCFKAAACIRILGLAILIAWLSSILFSTLPNNISISGKFLFNDVWAFSFLEYENILYFFHYNKAINLPEDY